MQETEDDTFSFIDKEFKRAEKEEPMQEMVGLKTMKEIQNSPFAGEFAMMTKEQYA